MFDSSYEERVLFDSAVGNNTYSSTSNPIRSSQISDKRKEKTENPSALKTKELYEIIHKKVTKKTHNHENLKKGDGTIAKCIELFNKGADSNVLIELEKSLRKEEYQKYYNYYTEKFLPALEIKVTESEELRKPLVLNNEEKSSQRSPTIRGKILKIISEITGITNKSSDKNYSSSVIQNQKDRQSNAMELFNKQSLSGEVEIPKNSVINPLEKDSLAKGVSGKGTPGIYNPLRSSGYHSASTALISKQPQARKEVAQSQLNSQSDLSIDSKDLKNKDPSKNANAVEVPSGANTSKLSSSSDLDSGINSSGLALSSRRSSVTSVTSTLFEENLNLVFSSIDQDEDQMHPEQFVEEEPQQCLILESRKKENMGQVTQMTSNQKKDSVQFEEKEEKAVLNKQKIKQFNKKNLHVVLVTGSALLAIGCIVAGAMTSGLVGAGLFVVAAVFATAAAAELCSNILSSKLTSISVSPLIDNKQYSKN